MVGLATERSTGGSPRPTAAIAAEGATVWVQDYQLQLVPKLLREARPDLKIGFFNHIPFPPPEIFAQLPWRRQIIDGLLGADLVGFQRSSDAGNFLRSARRFLRCQRQAAAGPRQGTTTATPPTLQGQALPDLHRRQADQRTGPAAGRH